MRIIKASCSTPFITGPATGTTPLRGRLSHKANRASGVITI